MTDNPISVKIRCSKPVREAVLAAVSATQSLNEAFNDKNSSLILLREKLEEKKKASALFENVTGMKWIL